MHDNNSETKQTLFTNNKHIGPDEYTWNQQTVDILGYFYNCHSYLIIQGPGGRMPDVHRL